MPRSGRQHWGRQHSAGEIDVRSCFYRELVTFYAFALLSLVSFPLVVDCRREEFEKNDHGGGPPYSDSGEAGTTANPDAPQLLFRGSSEGPTAAAQQPRRRKDGTSESSWGDANGGGAPLNHDQTSAFGTSFLETPRLHGEWSSKKQRKEKRPTTTTSQEHHGDGSTTEIMLKKSSTTTSMSGREDHSFSWASRLITGATSTSSALLEYYTSSEETRTTDAEKFRAEDQAVYVIGLSGLSSPLSLFLETETSTSLSVQQNDNSDEKTKGAALLLCQSALYILDTAWYRQAAAPTPYSTMLVEKAREDGGPDSKLGPLVSCKAVFQKESSEFLDLARKPDDQFKSKLASALESILLHGKGLKYSSPSAAKKAGYKRRTLCETANSVKVPDSVEGVRPIVPLKYAACCPDPTDADTVDEDRCKSERDQVMKLCNQGITCNSIQVKEGDGMGETIDAQLLARVVTSLTSQNTLKPDSKSLDAHLRDAHYEIQEASKLVINIPQDDDVWVNRLFLDSDPTVNMEAIAKFAKGTDLDRAAKRMMEQSFVQTTRLLVKAIEAAFDPSRVFRVINEAARTKGSTESGEVVTPQAANMLQNEFDMLAQFKNDLDQLCGWSRRRGTLLDLLRALRLVAMAALASRNYYQLKGALEAAAEGSLPLLAPLRQLIASLEEKLIQDHRLMIAFVTKNGPDLSVSESDAAVKSGSENTESTGHRMRAFLLKGGDGDAVLQKFKTTLNTFRLGFLIVWAKRVLLRTRHLIATLDLATLPGPALNAEGTTVGTGSDGEISCKNSDMGTLLKHLEKTRDDPSMILAENPSPEELQRVEAKERAKPETVDKLEENALIAESLAACAKSSEGQNNKIRDLLDTALKKGQDIVKRRQNVAKALLQGFDTAEEAVSHSLAAKAYGKDLSHVESLAIAEWHFSKKLIGSSPVDERQRAAASVILEEQRGAMPFLVEKDSAKHAYLDSRNDGADKKVDWEEYIQDEQNDVAFPVGHIRVPVYPTMTSLLTRIKEKATAPATASRRPPRPSTASRGRPQTAKREGFKEAGQPHPTTPNSVGSNPKQGAPPAATDPVEQQGATKPAARTRPQSASPGGRQASASAAAGRGLNIQTSDLAAPSSPSGGSSPASASPANKKSGNAATPKQAVGTPKGSGKNLALSKPGAGSGAAGKPGTGAASTTAEAPNANAEGEEQNGAEEKKVAARENGVEAALGAEAPKAPTSNSGEPTTSSGGDAEKPQTLFGFSVLTVGAAAIAGLVILLLAACLCRAMYISEADEDEEPETSTMLIKPSGAPSPTAKTGSSLGAATSMEEVPTPAETRATIPDLPGQENVMSGFDQLSEDEEEEDDESGASVAANVPVPVGPSAATTPPSGAAKTKPKKAKAKGKAAKQAKKASVTSAGSAAATGVAPPVGGTTDAAKPKKKAKTKAKGGAKGKKVAAEGQAAPTSPDSRLLESSGSSFVNNGDAGRLRARTREQKGDANPEVAGRDLSEDEKRVPTDEDHEEGSRDADRDANRDRSSSSSSTVERRMFFYGGYLKHEPRRPLVVKLPQHLRRTFSKKSNYYNPDSDFVAADDSPDTRFRRHAEARKIPATFGFGKKPSTRLRPVSEERQEDKKTGESRGSSKN
ncbi:unnamed protein product [Amoebophrya sp. A25]|nr:unnamed protein product [Amoebophrya sp. A25]|eukprot:GSA25T00012014001.1